MLIRQNQMPCARAHRIFGFRANAIERLLQVPRCTTGWEGTIDLHHRRVEILQQALKLHIADKGRIQNQNFGLGTALIQHIFQIAKTGLQTHDPKFAQAVNRGIGHLAKVLPKEM